MAFLTGLGDDGQAGPPMDFQISSSSSSSECGPDDIRSLYARECPVCSKWKKHFICKDCIAKGDFWLPGGGGGGTNGEGQRFQELHLQLLLKQQERDEIVTKCQNLTKTKDRALQLIEELEVYQRTVAFQKQLKADIEKKLGTIKQESGLIKKQNDEKERILPMYRGRLHNMELQRGKRVAELRKKAAFVSDRGTRLQELSRARILQLRQYVFPVHEVYADSAEGKILNDRFQASSVTLMSSNDSWSDEEDDTVRSLIAATSNRGGSRGGCASPSDLSSKSCLFHSITGVLGPSLPVSGDYSAFNTETEAAAQARGAVGRNPAHVITAGLTFLTQFVNMISYYLDLRLPHRLSYSEFSIECHANRKFNRKVAKLNANVVHLCASQGIPASYLQPRKTIANLLLLFDPSLAGVCKLGRRGPFEVAIQLAKSMEDSIEKDLVIYDEDSSDSDECGDYFPSDWETVHRGAVTEEMSQLQCMTRQQSYMQSTMDSESFLRSRTQAGIASNLVSSVTSFFRGWNA